MTTVLYVHGTGVREPAYSAAFDLLRTRLSRIRPDATVSRCYWGGAHGSRLGAGGVSVPDGRSYRGVDNEGESDDIEVALWGLLEADPLFELGVLAAAGREAVTDLPPNAAPPGVELGARVRNLSIPLSVELRNAGLDGVFSTAADSVLDSATGQDALRLETTLGGELRSALARAIVAEAMLTADARLGSALPLDGDHRDALVVAAAAELGGSERGIMVGVGKIAGRLALRMGVTKPIERRRAAITMAAAAAAGDVLMYLARGEHIRAFIHDQIKAASGQVVIVAHSLGGVASVDVLATADHDDTLAAVTLLVTVGSQSPLLYELNALPNLAFGGKLPDTFPRWVNIYDRRDLLSFTGAKVFAPEQNAPQLVYDYPVDNRAPFPRSHSAYFGNDKFYAVLDLVMP